MAGGRGSARRVAWIGIALAVTLVAAAGCTTLSGLLSSFRRPERGYSSPLAPQGEGLPPISPNPGGNPLRLTVYFAGSGGFHLVSEERTVIQRGETPEELAIMELIRGPAEEGHYRTIPKETRLLSLQVVEGIAYVNFSREVQTKHSGGTTGEAFTIQSVANTLAANNAQVKKVQFLLEGKIEEALWGHGITSEPIEPNRGLIEQGQKPG